MFIVESYVSVASLYFSHIVLEYIVLTLLDVLTTWFHVQNTHPIQTAVFLLFLELAHADSHIFETSPFKS